MFFVTLPLVTREEFEKLSDGEKWEFVKLKIERETNRETLRKIALDLYDNEFDSSERTDHVFSAYYQKH